MTAFINIRPVNLDIYMKKNLVLLALLFPLLCFSQNTWVLDLPGTDFGSLCAPTYDGGAAMITQSNDHVLKVDASGNLLWNAGIDTTGLQYLRGLTETSDHGIVAFGAGNGWSYSVIFKFDENGNILWQKRYDPPSSNLTIAWVCPTEEDGGFLFGGGECAMATYVVRCDNNGDIVWQKQYFGLQGGAGTGYCSTMQRTSPSSYMGTFNIITNGDLDWGFLKLDGSSNPILAKLIDEGPERDEVVASTATQAGGIAVVGTTTNYQLPSNENKMTLTVIDSNGTVLAYRVYDYTEQLQPAAIAQTSDGGYVITGSTYSLEILVVKTDATGNIQWQKVGTGSVTQSGTGVAPAGGGMFFLAGHAFNEKAFIALLTESSGQGLCAEGSIQLSPAAYFPTVTPLIASPASGTAIESTINYSIQNITTAPQVVCTSVGVDGATPSTTLQCSPNPFSDRLSVSVDEAVGGDGVLRLLDLGGRLIAERQVHAGELDLDWNVGKLPAGMYLLEHLHGGTRSATRLVCNGSN